MLNFVVLYVKPEQKALRHNYYHEKTTIMIMREIVSSIVSKQNEFLQVIL